MEKIIAKVEREPGEKNFSCVLEVDSVKARVLVSEAVMRQYAVGTRRPSQERKQLIVQGIKSLAKKIEVVSVY